MEYVSCAEVAAKWGISERRVQKLCEGERIIHIYRLVFFEITNIIRLGE